MKPEQASRTAGYMALFRAAETVRPASQRLFADSFAEHFLRPGLRRAVWLARRPALASFLNRYADQRTNIAACTSAPQPSKWKDTSSTTWPQPTLANAQNPEAFNFADAPSFPPLEGWEPLPLFDRVLGSARFQISLRDFNRRAELGF
jgi:hypothetical protein